VIAIGYTHYYCRPRVLDASRFRDFVADARIIVAALTGQGLQLAGPDGSGEPIIKSNLISLNGKTNCGHAPNSAIVVPWPSADASGIADPGQDAITGKWFAGALLSSRQCTGDCSYESFIIERIFKPEGWEKPKDGLYFAFCKTAFRPYDLSVISILIAFKKHFGDAVRVSSDGTDQQWFDGKLPCSKLLDYGFEFQINDSGELVPKAADVSLDIAGGSKGVV
jgi:hypothetical protein